MDERNKAKPSPGKSPSWGPAGNLLGQIMEKAGREDQDPELSRAGRKLQKMSQPKQRLRRPRRHGRNNIRAQSLLQHGYGGFR